MSLSETFYWHDYETSGAEVSIDRPLQFAGVRTNRQFEVLGEPLVIYSKPTPDYLPHPTAIRITGISPQHCLEHGLAEAAFIHQIHEQLSQPGTCGIGYNSLRFDDEITRYTLYRNFFEPYAREYGQGRSRWDLIDATRAIAALRPEGIEWPLNEQGLKSFRLEELSAANGIEHGAAHDALSDVMATIGLARLLQQKQPALFDQLYAQRSKDAIAPLLSVTEMRPVIHVSGMFGGARHNLAVIVPLALHPQNRNEVICADLAADPGVLAQPPEQIAERLFASKDQLGDEALRPGLKTVRINKGPVILPTTWLRGEAAERLGLDGDQHRAALATLRAMREQDAKGFEAKIQAVFAQRQFEKRTDPDQMLYDGFIDRADNTVMAEVREASPEQLAERSWVFKDRRLPELLFRYRARNYPGSLTAAERDQWREHCRQKLETEPRYDFVAELEQELAREDLSERQRGALNDLRLYAGNLLASLAT